MMRSLLPAVLCAAVLLAAAGCAKYNTFFNAKRMFDNAEQVREEAIKANQDPVAPTGGQKADYEGSIRKAQKLIDEYPGHGLTDDALFLQAKAYHRLQSFRMSIRKFDLLFSNFPATPFMEESLYLQSLNYLLLGSVVRSQDYLEQLGRQFPESEYQSMTLKVSGDNAYAMEDWAEAVEFYREFLVQFPDTDEWDRVGLKMGECHWELEEYAAAADILQEVSEKTTSAELGFRADLLRAKSLIRTGNHDLAAGLLSDLEEPAPTYQSEGDVLLAQVEMLMVQGEPGEAFPLLETMPDEWKTPQVKARSADILGVMRLERNELEDAQANFRDALAGKAFLEDEFHTRRLSENLNDYLAAENALSDAAAERIPRLQLLQANALLFGFERPGEAARLYRAAAVDSAADSTVAARALYGAIKVYREHLDLPDSAAYFNDLLQQLYPESPQAFELRTGGGDLLAFLLDKRGHEQSVRLANLSDEELAELMQVKDFEGGGPGAVAVRRVPVRRRLVYLARRDNLEYPPPEEVMAAARQRQLDAEAQQAEVGGGDPAGADTVGSDGQPTVRGAFRDVGTGTGPAEGGDLPDEAVVGDPGAVPGEGITPAVPIGGEDQPTSPDVQDADDEQKDPRKDEEEGDEEEDPEEKKKKKRSWEFDLRSPAADPDTHPVGEPRS